MDYDKNSANWQANRLGKGRKNSSSENLFLPKDFENHPPDIKNLRLGEEVLVLSRPIGPFDEWEAVGIATIEVLSLNPEYIVVGHHFNSDKSYSRTLVDKGRIRRQQ